MTPAHKSGDSSAVCAKELQHIEQCGHTPDFVTTMSNSELKRLESKLVRKVDARLMPAVIVMYLLNYIDRNNIASARLGGLEDDLGLKGSEYQTCGWHYSSPTD